LQLEKEGDVNRLWTD